MTERPPRPAIIYARVSSRKQVKEGGGIESQATRCRSYASARGYEVVAMFTDDMTGSQARRPGMDAMLSFLKQHKSNPHIVLIDDISRLARGLKAHIALRDELARAGGILESPSVVFGDDSDSQFLENVLASSAQHFAQKNREQTINRMKARLMNGYYVNARPPLGYRYIKGHGKELVRDEPIASIVQEALEGFASGRFTSKGEVRQFLEDQPEFPKNGKGGVTHERAHVLLTQPVYAGRIEAPAWGISLREGKHEGLISWETFCKVQDRLNGGARVQNRIDLHEDFVLRGAVDCADCDKPLTACWSKGKNRKYPYYLCFNKDCESYRKSIARDQLESEFEVLLEQLQPTRSLFTVASKMFRDLWDHMATTNAERAARLKSDLARLDAGMTKLVDKMLETENPIVSEQIEKRITALEVEKQLVAEKIEKLAEPARGYDEMFEHALTFLSNPYKIWQKGTFADRRNVLKLAFTDRLKYSRIEGLRTPQTSIPFKVLGGFWDGGRELAHPTGFEPVTSAFGGQVYRSSAIHLRPESPRKPSFPVHNCPILFYGIFAGRVFEGFYGPQPRQGKGEAETTPQGRAPLAAH